MIFVVLGTQDKQFSRLLKLVEEEIKQSHITEDVIVQSGNTSFKSDYFQVIPFMDMNTFEQYIKQASFIICHAGYGTLSTALKNNKKVIAIPRLQKYGEHTNDHQLQILSEYEKKGYLIAVYEKDSLSIALEKIKDFTPNSYTDNTNQLCDLVKRYIDE